MRWFSSLITPIYDKKRYGEGDWWLVTEMGGYEGDGWLKKELGGLEGDGWLVIDMGG